MRKTVQITLIGLVFTYFISNDIRAQKYQTAFEYLEYMSNLQKEINKDVWQFVSVSAHSKRENKIALKKNEMIQTVRNSENLIRQMPAYEENTELRDSMAEYLNLIFHVMNEDYRSIIDLEQAAEESYDLMETYLKIKDMANQKLDDAGKSIQKTEEKFASEHNIKLTSNLSEIGKKLEEANKAIRYYNKIYLIFFKAHKESEFMWAHYENKDLTAAQQAKGNLVKYSTEGVADIKSVLMFKGDATLKKACDEILSFYIKKEAPFFEELSDFDIKKEQFEKIKKIIDSKKPEDLTEEDVKVFNEKVDDLNNSTQKINAKMEIQNKKRKDLIEYWNKTSSTFLDNQIP